MNNIHHFAQILSGNDTVYQLDWSAGTGAIDRSKAISMIVQRLPQFHTAILYNYPDDDSPQRQPVFQQHPNIVARSKSGSIPKICWDAVNILDNLADGNDPDQNFAEPKQGSKVPLSA